MNYYLLEEKTGSIGCAALERADSEICYLERLSVVPERRNEGLGTRLVHHCFREAGAMGITTLGIGIIADQHELRQWYEKLGFVETGRKRFEHLPFEVLFMKSGL